MTDLNLMDASTILTTAEAARIRGCSPATIVRACDSGELGCFKTPGGHRRIHLGNLRYWMTVTGVIRNEDSPS